MKLINEKMYTLIKTQKKPAPDVLFFFENYKYPDEYFTYIKKHYIETGKLLKYQKIMSEDKMSVAYITQWRSKIDYLSYITDDFIFDFISKSTDYDIDHDIESFMEVK